MEGIEQALKKAADYLISLQSEEGYFKGDLETNVTMEAEDLLLREFLGIRDEEILSSTAKWIRSKQNPDGGWPVFFGGPSDLSTTIEAYAALKLAGDSPEAPHMRKAAELVRKMGGVEASRVFTRIWLALFGIVSWDEVPALPPEIMFLPPSVPLNVYDFACWARQTVVALTIVYAHKPVRPLPISLDELFTGLPKELSPSDWQGRLFIYLDKALKFYEKRLVSLPLFRSLRRLALNLAEEWVIKRQEADGSWGGIQPPWVYSLMGLKLQGYPLTHPVMDKGIKGLDGFTVYENGMRWLEACQSPVWDTALSVLALASWEEGVVREPIERAVKWLISKEVRVKGDWAVKRPHLEPSGFSFEFENVNYPDVDDTAVVVMALHASLPLLGSEALRKEVRAVIERSINWVLGMQSRCGGWGAFDADNTRGLVRKLPFCDFGEVIDPPSADVTAHALEMLYSLGRVGREAERGLKWLLAEQEPDGGWFGRWGANYIYGTWSALCALKAAKKSDEEAARRGRRFLISHQRQDGGFGEDLRSYEDAAYRAKGEPTPSQTAWAALGLMTGEDGESRQAAAKALEFLASVQKDDGSYDEPYFTGTGFPRDFYINYRLYRQVFPVMALARAWREAK